MAEPLKLMYSERFIDSLSKALSEIDQNFHSQGFKNLVFNNDWNNLELKDRTKHIASSINDTLKYAYEHQVALLLKIADRFKGYTGTIFPTFVEIFGLDYPEISIQALKEFTKYSTSEFAIRPFIINYPETMHTLLKWSKDENYHVRRLASEGCRPLLPWAMKLSAFIEDPSPIIPILENLKNDSEDYVYRSVANNLNDISKNHPDLVLSICSEWVNISKTTNWVAKHGLRTLLKQGNQKAMKIFGFGAIDSIHIQQFSLNHEKLPIGTEALLNIHINRIKGKEEQKFRFEYIVGYMKKNGVQNEKVFQIKECTLAMNEELKAVKKISFKDLSTRKHYPGMHYIILKINGIKTERINFELTN
ncbi:DNA alkylation repair protein [Crocinitomix algicola]|uniref:DNA alkylation repair protein n=1 Tax=Crocinitomix algicola TaxID=1740263 RepID=UPI0008726D8C|nr:DNA alkylation repair protein [Crocinitomix algicola]